MDSRTESHSCVILGAPGVSAFESLREPPKHCELRGAHSVGWYKVGLTLPPLPFRPHSLEVAELSISCLFCFVFFSSWSERLSGFVLTL